MALCAVFNVTDHLRFWFSVNLADGDRYTRAVGLPDCDLYIGCVWFVAVVTDLLSPWFPVKLTDSDAQIVVHRSGFLL